MGTENCIRINIRAPENTINGECLPAVAASIAMLGVTGERRSTTDQQH